MLNRYGLGIGGIILGGLIVWAFFGFKNPFGQASAAPKAGDACRDAMGVAGTIQADGTCKA